jgi:hypothetical protein
LPCLPVALTLGLTLGLSDRPPRVDHQQQRARIFAFTVGLAMRGQNIAGEPDQVVAVMGDIGDDSAGFGNTVSWPVGLAGL